MIEIGLYIFYKRTGFPGSFPLYGHSWWKKTTSVYVIRLLAFSLRWTSMTNGHPMPEGVVRQPFG